MVFLVENSLIMTQKGKWDRDSSHQADKNLNVCKGKVNVPQVLKTKTFQKKTSRSLMKFMCVSGTVPFLLLSLESQENPVPSWMESVGSERETLEPRRRSEISRNNFQEHLRII